MISKRNWLAWAALIAAGACATPTFPDYDPAITGDIVARDVPISIARTDPTMHVKAHPEDECGIIFKLTRQTDVLQRDADGRLHRRDFDDLAIGRAVHVWTRLVRDSCPKQAHADAVEIL
jgi:hypothetical protein